MDKQFKVKYNHLIKRLNKADAYLEDKTKDDDLKLKWLEEFNKIIISISRMQKEYKEEFGEEMETELKFNGFKIDN